MSIAAKYPISQYLGGIVEAIKAAPGNDANPNDVETIRFYGELGNDIPDSQLPNLLVAIAHATRAVSENAAAKEKFTAAKGYTYVKDAQNAIMATLDKASEELVEKRG